MIEQNDLIVLDNLQIIVGMSPSLTPEASCKSMAVIEKFKTLAQAFLDVKGLPEKIALL